MTQPNADALAELAKDFPRVAEFLKRKPMSRIEDMLMLYDLAATLNVQRKQLESRVEKLEEALEFYAGNHLDRESIDSSERYRLHVCQDMGVRARDALAKEQPREYLQKLWRRNYLGRQSFKRETSAPIGQVEGATLYSQSRHRRRDDGDHLSKPLR